MATLTFKKFLESNLTYADYVKLPAHLAISRKATTMLLEKPKHRIKKLELEKIEQLVIATRKKDDFAQGTLNKLFKLL